MRAPPNLEEGELDPPGQPGVVARVAARADVIDVMPEKEHSTDTLKV
jgi:hypothetical protein